MVSCWATCGHPARLIELNAKGAVKNEVEFETGIPSVHGQFRQAIKSKKGTYIVPLMGKSAVVELDQARERAEPVECERKSLFCARTTEW